MIYADLQGKTHVPEDVLTSNCIELMSLLPDKNLIDFFSLSIDAHNKEINLSEYTLIDSLEFWPWLNHGGEPDILCSLKNNEANKRIILIIEVKHGAGKSGHDDNDSAESDADISSDQLAKYWQAAINQYEDEVVVIYLTHHRHFPKQDIVDSIKSSRGKAIIYWISWFHLYRFVVDKLAVYKNSGTETRILKKLKCYLYEKGYIKFEMWTSPIPLEHMRIYSRRYIVQSKSSNNLVYERTYCSGVKLYKCDKFYSSNV